MCKLPRAEGVAVKQSGAVQKARPRCYLCYLVLQFDFALVISGARYYNIPYVESAF